MTLQEARNYLSAMTANMESGIDSFVFNAAQAQEAIAALLLDEINSFDTKDGKFIPNQPIARKIQLIERRMYAILARYYDPALLSYLGVYDLVDSDVKYLHQQVNNISVTAADISTVRTSVYNQAETYLTTSLADAYVQPAKYLMMQVVTNGKTIKQAKSMVKNWNDGELPAGELTSGMRAPRLQSYAGQIARDSLFQYNGTVQDNIGKKYKLTKFLYVGGLVEDSRPLCKHLVSLDRKIELKEIPALLLQYPDGTIPNTTMENFPVRRGGFNCLHNVMMVR
jgi:hypothetical protein